MRLTWAHLALPVALVVAVAVSSSHDQSVEAAGNIGAVIDVSAAIGGRYTAPRGIFEDPCTPPTEYVTILDPKSLPAGSIGASTRMGADGIPERAVVTYCKEPVSGDIVAGTLAIYWVGVPTPADLVPAVLAYLPDYLDPPEVSWPNMSPEHGWLFVKVPMDFRSSNLSPVTVTATVRNILGDTATASATATPDQLTFESGEGGSAVCSAAEARAAYVPGVYGACSYQYKNSSAIAGGEFGTTSTMRWVVTSNPVDPTQPPELTTASDQSLAVSEVQAIVTCYGSSC
jgi:hypothetical protein